MSDRKYSDSFGVSDCYPKQTFRKERGSEAITEAKTISFVVPHSEALRLAAAIIESAKTRAHGNIEIKVDRRESKRAVGTGLLTGTVTWV